MFHPRPIIRQHHRGQMPSIRRESVKPTGHTPSHTMPCNRREFVRPTGHTPTLMVIGNGRDNDLTTPNQITIRQHRRVLKMPSTLKEESVKPTGPTPMFMVTGIRNGLTRPHQTPHAPTERPDGKMKKSPFPTLPPLVGTDAFKTHNPRVKARAPQGHPSGASDPLPPQRVTGQLPHVNRSSVGKQASAQKQSPVRPIQKKTASKKKQPHKDQPQMPVRLLPVADFPPVSESVRAVMLRIAKQQHLERQRAAVTGRTWLPKNVLIG